MGRSAVTLLVLAAALVAASPARAYDEADLKRAIAREMRHAGTRAGAYVSDAATGRAMYSLRDTKRWIPASVNKLYTTATALLTLGPKATLATKAVAAGAVDEAGVLHGDLALVGEGDPFFGRAEAAQLARAVRDAGVVSVTGGVVGDETYFDRRRAARFDGYDGEIGGVLSALAYDGGIYGGHAQLRAARFAARRFDAELDAAGVRTGRSGRAGQAPAGAAALASVRSDSIAEIARLINVPSNNFAAEMLLKGIGARYGHAGSTRAGAAVATQTLGGFGVRPRIEDGSGLSRANRTSPRQVARLLEHMAADPAGGAFRASLAVAGRSGTVAGRMRGTLAAGNCRVKTGTLHDVSALAGYCTTRDDRLVTFALIMNRVAPYRARALQDHIAIAIARLNETPAGEPPPPVPVPAPPAPGAPEDGGASPSP